MIGAVPLEYFLSEYLRGAAQCCVNYLKGDRKMKVLGQLKAEGCFAYVENKSDLIGFYSIGKNAKRINLNSYSIAEWARCFASILGSREVEQRAPRQYVATSMIAAYGVGKTTLPVEQRNQLITHGQLTRSQWVFKKIPKGTEEKWTLSKIGEACLFQIPFRLLVDFAALVLRDEIVRKESFPFWVPAISAHAADVWNSEGFFKSQTDYLKFETPILVAKAPEIVAPPVVVPAKKVELAIPAKRTDPSPKELLLAHLKRVTELGDEVGEQAPEALRKRLPFLRHAIDELKDDNVAEVALAASYDTSEARLELEELHQKLKEATLEALKVRAEEVRKLEESSEAKLGELSKTLGQNQAVLVQTKAERKALDEERAELGELAKSIEARRIKLNADLVKRREELEVTVLADVRQKLDEGQKKLVADQAALALEKQVFEGEKASYVPPKPESIQPEKESETPPSIQEDGMLELIQEELVQLTSENNSLKVQLAKPWQQLVRELLPVRP